MPLSLFQQTTLEEDQLFYHTFPNSHPSHYPSYLYRQYEPQYYPAPLITTSAFNAALHFYGNLNHHQSIGSVNKPTPLPEQPQTTHRPHRWSDELPGPTCHRDRLRPESTSSPARPRMRLDPLPTKRQPEKKPPLACLFCRGRKIACGPPLPSSVDKTCNQCARRSLPCKYPSESRRGQRKKVPASTDTIVD